MTHSHPMLSSSSSSSPIAWMIIALYSSSSTTTTTTTVNAFSPLQPLRQVQLHTLSAAAWRCGGETWSSTSTAPRIHKLSSSSFSQSSSSSMLLNLSSKPENNEDEEANKEAAAATTPPKPSTSPQVVSSETASRARASVSAESIERARVRLQQQANAEKPPPRPMDPLVRSLTRMDETATNKNAPTKQIPFFGEVVLDRSLFLFVPAAIFAVLGLVMSITVILNSGDAIVADLVATTTTTDTTTSRSSNAPASSLFGVGDASSRPPVSDCRGICSSQEQDLEGLRNFMTSFGK